MDMSFTINAGRDAAALLQTDALLQSPVGGRAATALHQKILPQALLKNYAYNLLAYLRECALYNMPVHLPRANHPNLTVEIPEVRGLMFGNLFISRLMVWVGAHWRGREEIHCRLRIIEEKTQCMMALNQQIAGLAQQPVVTDATAHIAALQLFQRMGKNFSADAVMRRYPSVLCLNNDLFIGLGNSDEAEALLQLFTDRYSAIVTGYPIVPFNLAAMKYKDFYKALAR
jgi:hypothetical protein